MLCGSKPVSCVSSVPAPDSGIAACAMTTDESHRSSSSVVTLPGFPGEEVLSHEGRIWKMAAITKLAAEDMMAWPFRGFSGTHRQMSCLIFLKNWANVIQNDTKFSAAQVTNVRKICSKEVKIRQMSRRLLKIFLTRGKCHSKCHEIFLRGVAAQVTNDRKNVANVA